MGSDQIRELNVMLEEYVDVPRATSLLNMHYIPTPTKRRKQSSDDEQFSSGDDGGQDDEEF
jgi:hypothetical protein